MTGQPGKARRRGQLAEAWVDTLVPPSPVGKALHTHLGRGLELEHWGPRRWALWPEPSLHFSDASSGAGCGPACV